MDIELKSVIEEMNKGVAALRSEVESKGDKETIGRLEAEVARTLEAKSALEGRISAMEAAQSRVGTFAKGTEAGDEYKTAFVNFLRKSQDYSAKSVVTELATKQVNIGTPAAGGVAVPEVIATDIARVAGTRSAIRALARVVTVGTADYKELLNLGGAASEWVGETTTRNVTDTPTLKEVAPTFGEIAARAQATNWSLEDIFFDVQAWLVNELAREFGAKEAKAFIDGDGANKPTGLLNGTTVGVVKTGVAGAFGANPYDNIIDLITAVKGEYQANANFVMNTKTFASLIKVKDTTGAYLFPQNLSGKLEQSILGYAVNIDDQMPDVAANAKSILFGDFARGYLIADRIGMSLLVNPYKTSGLVEFEGRKRVGGIVKDADALRALHFAA